MDAERKAWLRQAAEGNGDIYTIEALDALDAAEARAEKTPTQAAECILRAVDEMRSLRAERDRLREALVRIVNRDGWKGRMFHLAEAITIAAEAINHPECPGEIAALLVDEVGDE